MPITLDAPAALLSPKHKAKAGPGIGPPTAAANLGLDARFVQLDPDAPSALLSPKHPFTILDANDAWCDVTKYSKQQSVGRGLGFLYGQGTEQHLVSEMNAEIGGGRGCVATLTCYTRTGESFRNTITLLPVEGGTRLLAVCEMQSPEGKVNLSMQQLRERRLARLSGIIPSPEGKAFSAPHGVPRIPSLGPAVLFGGEKGTIVGCTDSWLDMCEFERDDVIGKTAQLFQGPATDMDEAARISQAAKDKRVYSGSLTNYTQSGRAVTNDLQMIPLKVVGEDKSYILTLNNFTMQDPPKMVLPKYDEPYIIDAKTWSPPARARARGPRRGLGRRRHRQRALCARMALAPFDTTKWKSRQCDVTQPGVSGADSRLDHRYIDFFLAAADKREEALVGALQARQAQVAHLEKAARDRDRRFIELERRLSIAGSSNKAELPANKQVSKAWEVAVLSGMIGEGVDDGRFDQSLTLLPPDKLEAVVRQTLTTASRIMPDKMANLTQVPPELTVRSAQKPGPQEPGHDTMCKWCGGSGNLRAS